MADKPVDTPLVLRPSDPTARTSAMIFALLGVVGAVGLIVGAVSGNVITAVVGGIILVVGAALATLMLVGRTTMRVSVDGEALHIAGRGVPRADITGLHRRRHGRAGLDVMGRDDAVLYSMPAWFDATQEQELATALGVGITEPPPPEEEPEAAEPDDATG